MALVMLVFAAILTAVPAGAVGGAPLPCVTGTVPVLQDACKKEAWRAVYDNPDGRGGSEYPFGVVASPTGDRVFVTGISHDDASDSAQYQTVAFDQRSGERLWVVQHPKPVARVAVPHPIAVSPDGSRVYVVGIQDYLEQSIFVTPTGDFATIAYDAATGQQLWSAPYDGPGRTQDSAQAVAISPDGGQVYVTGFSNATPAASNRDNDYATIAYDARTGRRLWLARYDAGGCCGDRANTLAVSPDGSRVVVSGISQQDYGTVAYDAATGEELWAAHYDGAVGPDGGTATSLGISPDGRRVFVSGQASFGIGTVAYDAGTGQQVWDQRYSRGGYSEGNALAVSPAGDRVYVAGLVSPTRGYNGANFATVAYDADTGKQVWAQQYGYGQYDGANDLALSPDGRRVYVAGFSFTSAGATGYDRAVVAYDSGTGEPAWVARAESAAHPYVGSLDVGPTGRVFTDAYLQYTLLDGKDSDSDFGLLAFDE